MDANLLKFFLRERAGLREDMFRHRQLADVVQQRRGFDALDLVVGHAERAGDAGGVHLHPSDVTLRGLILRVDRERQRLNGREMQV